MERLPGDPPETEGEMLAVLLRHYGSHERPRVIYDWYCKGADIPEAVLSDVWVSRNEQMPGDIAPECWEEMFDCCGVVTDGAEVPQPPFVVYRAGHLGGMSWSRNREAIQPFEERGREVHMLTVTDPRDVLAAFDGRDEAEIVLRPHAAERAREHSTDRLSEG